MYIGPIPFRVASLLKNPIRSTLTSDMGLLAHTDASPTPSKDIRLSGPTHNWHDIVRFRPSPHGFVPTWGFVRPTSKRPHIFH
jgi:hypothetical protein